jgi:hypothetical protein
VKILLSVLIGERCEGAFGSWWQFLAWGTITDTERMVWCSNLVLARFVGVFLKEKDDASIDP